MRAFPQERLTDATGRVSQAWQRFFQSVNGDASGGTVTNISVTGNSGILGFVNDPKGAANIVLSLGAITPTSVAATGPINGTNLSGTNTGDQTITLTGDATGSGTGSFAVNVAKINGVSFAGLATGLLKNTTGTGAPSIAVAGSDYLVPPSGTAIQKANGGGALANAVAGTDYIAPGGALGTPSSGNLANCNGLPLSGTTGTLPVGSGGTGISSFAWSTYTPTASAGSGAFTTLGTLTGRYFTIGKLMFFSLVVPITTNGTAAGYVQVSLPPGFTVAAADYYSSGRSNVVGKMLSVRIVASQQYAEIRNYDGTYPGASGETLEISGWYELA